MAATESRIFADRYFREARRREAQHASWISPGTSTWCEALKDLFNRMGEAGSPNKQAALLKAAITYMESVKPADAMHIGFVGGARGKRSAALVFAAFSAGNGRWRQRFEPGMVPHQFESCDWWLDRRGRMPAFWNYTKHTACYWLVNFTLQLAQLVEPKRQWRIITSSKHATVWDGGQLLFDFNFQAMGISSEECFKLAHKRVLKPGEPLRVHLAEHYSQETKRLEQRRIRHGDELAGSLNKKVTNLLDQKISGMVKQ